MRLSSQLSHAVQTPFATRAAPETWALATLGFVLMACSPVAEASSKPRQERAALASPGWNAVAPMSQPRSQHTATLLPDGMLLVLGGVRRPDSSYSADLYNPTTQTWSRACNWSTVPIPSPNYRHPNYPQGELLLGDVPFSIPTSGNNVWNSYHAAGGGPGTVSVLLQPNVMGAQEVDTLINSWWGKTGGPYAYLEFWGSAGAYYRHNLFGAIDIRDYQQADWTNTINGTTTINVFQDGARGRLDKQRIFLPQAFANQSLTQVKLTDLGSPEQQRTMLVALSVAHHCGGTHTGHTATLLSSGKVLVLSEDAPSSGQASNEVYDPATRTWSPAAASIQLRSGHTATRLPDGRVLVVGGVSPFTGDLILERELYDPDADTWSLAGFTQGRTGHTATLLRNGKVLIVGGPGAGSEVYDPATRLTFSTGSLIEPRYNHTATLLPNGTVLVVGGQSTTHGYLRSSELYDPDTNTWSAASSLEAERSLHTATLLPNGTVLVVGGLDSSSSPLASSEVYDPLTNTWTPGAMLTQARAGHSATVLKSGEVLSVVIVGGYNSTLNGGTDLLSAESFTPQEPRTIFSAPPDNPTRDATATLDFSAGGTGFRYLCSLDQAAFEPCTSPWTIPSLTEGSHTVRVQARDAEGNVEASPSTYHWRVDTTPPETFFASTPEPETRLRSSSFSFSSDEGPVTFECNLDGEHFAPCPRAFASLEDGEHQLAVQARDEAGNVDLSPAQYFWKVDTVAPGEPSLQEPAPGQEFRTARLLFSGTAEPATTVTLRVDGVEVDSVQVDAQGFWRSQPGVPLSWGEHHVSATATDRAGNTSPPLPEVSFSTSRRGAYSLGCSAGSPSWQASWPWALLLLGLLRPRSRRFH